MKKEWLISFRSVTFAQHAERVLLREHIYCQLQRTPKTLTARGCGYCLRLDGKDAAAAVALLHREQIAYGKLYAPDDNGTLREQTHDLS